MSNFISWMTLCKATMDSNVARFNLTEEEKSTYKKNYLRLLDSTKTTCCFCGKRINITEDEWGNNADPCISKEDFINAVRCCNECNAKIVLPTRMKCRAVGVSARLYSA